MAVSDWYDASGWPATGTAGASSSARAEMLLIENNISAKLPDLAGGHGGEIVVVNAAGTALDGVAAGATTEILVGGGASAVPVWTTATGSGAPVRATSPTLVTPNLGTPSALVGTNISGTAASLTAGSVTNLTLGGAVVFSGAYSMQFTVPGAYTYTLPGLTCIIPSEQLQQNSKSAAYTMVLADANKHILHPSADTSARTWTIPANASVAYPIGTAITFVNQNGAGVITIAITSDTMRLAAAGTTGSRTLAANGIATALKITATEWIISGSGLT